MYPVLSYTVTCNSISLLVEKLKEEEAEWEKLGVRLGIPYATVNVINIKPGARTTDQKFKEVIGLWMKFEPKERTWGRLANSVERCNKSLAVKLRKGKSYKDGQTGECVYIPGLFNNCSFTMCPDVVDMTMNEYCDILDSLRSDWKRFGIVLGILVTDLDTIDDPLKTSDCMRNLLTKWISDYPEKASLSALCEALRKVKNRALAHALENDDEILVEVGLKPKGEQRELFMKQPA